MTLLIGWVLTRGGSRFLFSLPFFDHLSMAIVYILCVFSMLLICDWRIDFNNIHIYIFFLTSYFYF